MKTCLILIDAQESFRHRPYFTPANLPGYLAEQNALIDGCVARDIPIVRIFHAVSYTHLTLPTTPYV